MFWLTDEWRLEESLGTPESLIADGDNLSIWELVALFQRAGGGCGLHFLFEIKSNVAQFFLRWGSIKLVFSKDTQSNNNFNVSIGSLVQH